MIFTPRPMSWVRATNFLYVENPTKVEKHLTVSVLTNKHAYKIIIINQNLINKELHKWLFAFGNLEGNHTYLDTPCIKWTPLRELFRVWNENIELYELPSWSHMNTDVSGKWRAFRLPIARRYSMMQSLLFILFQVTQTYFWSFGLPFYQLLHPRTCHIPCWLDINLDLSVAWITSSCPNLKVISHVCAFHNRGLLLTFDLPKLLPITWNVWLTKNLFWLPGNLFSYNTRINPNTT